MTVSENVFNRGAFSRVRRNHALEHATLAVLTEKNPRLRMAGYSDPKGFWLAGEIETEKVEEAVQQALQRMRSGESDLAVHPHCGTNLVTTGFLAGALGWLGMLNSGRTYRERMERLPLVISLVTLGMMVAQPLGPKVQEHVTTSADMSGMEVVRIELSKRGDVHLHRVVTKQ